MTLLDREDSGKVLPEMPNFKQLDSETREALLGWSANGFAVLKKFFDESRVEQINEEVEDLIRTKRARWKGDRKIMFAIHYSDIIRQAGTDPELLNILELLMGKQVALFQSINFKQGSEQRCHSDSIHMTTFPYGNLIAAWIALEDIGSEQGPLHYYPGSHKLPYVMNPDFGNTGTRWFLGSRPYSAYEDRIEEMVLERGLDKKIFYPQKGDMLIWHANLLHGGEPHINKNHSRKSMVFHYYTNDAICFHEITQRPTLKKQIYH